jgi:hypothetical protein
MENFNELQSLWHQQTTVGPKPNSETIETKSLRKIKAQRAKHYWTIGILATTILVLLYLYSFIYRDEIANNIKGLALMIIVIIIRCALEIVSIIKFKRIDFTTSLNNYSNQLISYYKLRKAIHFFFTPAIYLLYTIGFVSLLPLFKENFSKGFYLYVVVSGFGFLAFFSFLLFTIIKKDLADLKFLQKNDNN